MVTEDYVSYEVAKLLKEKGFDTQSYASIKLFCGNNTYYEVNGEWITPEEDIIIPTLQMAMKWLREVHKLYCDIRVGDGDFVIDIISLKDGEFGCEVAEPESCVYPTYEEAAEAAIKYVLENLI